MLDCNRAPSRSAPSRSLAGRQLATPADGARAVPAGGGSSLPLPGGSGDIRPAGMMTGLRGNSLDWDRKERVTPAKNAHGLSNHRGRTLRPGPRKRVAGAELWRSLAAASAVVERRKASALRFQRAPRPLPSFRASGRERGQGAEVGSTRLPAFRFLFFSFFFVARMKPTGPARSGRPDDRLRENPGSAFKFFASFLVAPGFRFAASGLHCASHPIVMNPALHCRIDLTKIVFAAGFFAWRGQQNSDAKKPRRENEILFATSPRVRGEVERSEGEGALPRF